MTPTGNSNNENMEKKMQTTTPSSLASVAGNREQRVPGTNLLGTGLETRGVHAWFGTKHVLSDVSLDFAAGTVTALIGPSGCGKSTYLRRINRMHEFIPTAALAGEVLLDGKDIYAPGTDVTKIRLRVGMVFQKPNPFPKSIYENIAFGPKVNGRPKKSELDDIVEKSLKSAALWDEVKDRLNESALGLSGGQQQRLCIARSIAVEPEVILMDEPCSALDPIATLRIEELMAELKKQYTIVIVTHNMQQAARVSSYTAFYVTEVNLTSDRRTGKLVEFNETKKMFSTPDDERTEAYVTGKMG